MFFIYDHTVLQKEEDDLKDAIIYFDPPSTPVETQCAICGQLMGMVMLCKNLMGFYPCLYKLQKEKFAVKCLGKYTLALAGNGVDEMLKNQLECLYAMFIFYQNSIGQYYKNGYNTGEQVWTSYVQFIRHYGNKVTASFKSLPFIEIAQSQLKGQLIVQHSTHLLQYCSQHYPVFAGCILYRNSVLLTEFSADFTFRLLMIGPQTTSQVFQVRNFDELLPDGVQIIPVYLTTEEYRNFTKNLQITPKYYSTKQASQRETFKKPVETSPEKPLLDKKDFSRISDGSLCHLQKNHNNVSTHNESNISNDLVAQEKGNVSQNLSDPSEIMKNIKSIAARSSSIASLKIEQVSRKSRGFENLSDPKDVQAKKNGVLPQNENIESINSQTLLDSSHKDEIKTGDKNFEQSSEYDSSVTTDQSFSILSKEDVESNISSTSEINGETVVIPDYSVVSTTSKNLQKKEMSGDCTLVYQRPGIENEKKLCTVETVESEPPKDINTKLSDESEDSNHHKSYSPKESVICYDKVDEQMSDEDTRDCVNPSTNKEYEDDAGLGSKEISWTDFVRYEDEENVPVDLYIQSNSEMLIVLLMEKNTTNSSEVVEDMWKKILPELAKLEAELQMSLQKPQPKKSNEALSYNYLQFNGFRRSLSGKIAISETKVEPISADESHFCETAVMLHNMYATHPHLKDVTLRNSRSVIYGHNMMKQETFFQKVLSRTGSDAPSEKDTTLLIERKAKERLQKEQGITLV